MEVFDARTLHSVLKCLTKAQEALPVVIWKDKQGVQPLYLGMVSHQGEGLAREGDGAPFTVLGVLEGQGGSLQVHIGPA